MLVVVGIFLELLSFDSLLSFDVVCRVDMVTWFCSGMWGVCMVVVVFAIYMVCLIGLVWILSWSISRVSI